MEIWKPIINYENIYEISNYGNVKSINRYVIDKNNITTFRKGKKETIKT